ncbi:MAG: CYTH domain-containing protein, partial [Pseudonocardiaceae bacterium]
MRVLLLDPDCEAAHRRAAEISEGYSSFLSGILLSIERLRDLAEETGTVQCHLYSLLPTWRVISLDNTMFVSAFGETHEGHTSPMHRLVGSPHGALHRVSVGSWTTCAAPHDRSCEPGGTVAIEAELKAVVRDVDAVRAALDERASAEMSTYADRYFDYPDHRLTEQGRELRVRTITDDRGQTQVLL